MPKLDQLEIICPDGNIFFHDLSPDKGITNIGQHPDNDIVIDSPSVGLFQAVLDHQKKPFRIMILDKERVAKVDGKPLEPNVFQELHDWQSVDLDGFTLTLLENMDVPARGPEAGGQPARLTITEEKAPVLTQAEPSVALAAVPVMPNSLINIRPPDVRDEYIVVDLPNRERTIDVEQVASYEINIANGGPIVAEFDVTVEGVNLDWVTIYPQRVNLNEGAQGSILISIIPPRQTTSSAGEHYLAFSVTSPNYAGHVSRLGATLFVNPYYEFSVGNLSPSQQNASWRKNSSETSLPVVNQGNDVSSYQIIAQDTGNGCRFEFPMNNQVSLVKQVEIKVSPGKALDVPIKITPLKRSLVRLRPQQYQYSVTTQSLNESSAIRTVAGTFTSRPLFGPFSVLLAAILVAIGIFLLFQPHIYSLSASPEVVPFGSPVTLTWRSSLFTSSLQFKNLTDVVLKSGQNQLNVVPTTTLTTYTLVGRNWLSTLLSLPDVTLTTDPVLAIPPLPTISTFSVDKTDIIQGQTVNVKWAIQNATSAVLTVENVPTALTPDQLNGEKVLPLNNDTLIVLEATNASGTVYQSQYVRVWSPSDLKVDFTVTPAQVTSGDPVTVTWDVAGAGFTVDTVTVAPFSDPLPAKYSLQYFPTESMYFVLKVNVQDYTLSVPKYVTVLPADAQPVINYFKANPTALTSAATVEFSWSVSGPVDSITISDKTGVVKSGLAAEGFADIPVSATGTYVLTATKGKQSAAAVVDVLVTTLRDVNIKITSMVPQLGISRGDTVYVYYSIAPKVADSTAPEISGSVVITDGFDSCEVKLPITSCEFVFHRSGNNKQLTATYSGDANYNRTTSAPYPSATTYLTVYGSTVSISSISISYTQPVMSAAVLQNLSGSVQAVPAGPVVGQVGYLIFNLTPTAASATTPVQGNFDVLVQNLDVTTATPTPICLNVALVIGKDASGNNVGVGVCKFVFTSTGNRAFLVTYKGNEIYDSFNSDYTDPNQAALKVTVGQANTQIKLTAQSPTGSAQVGQQVTLTLQVSVAAQGGSPVPGIGTVTVKDNSQTYCQKAIDANGLAVCSFVPNQAIAALLITYKGDTTNYLDSDSTSTILYAITKAKVDVAITGFQFTPLGTNNNPTVGQTVAVQIKAYSDINGTDVKEGTLRVTLTDRSSSTAATLCTFDLATSSIPLTCNVLVKHGGLNLVSTDFTATANFTGGTLASQQFNTNPAAVNVQTFSLNPAQVIEGSQATVTFNVTPTFSTTLVPSGTFIVQSSIGDSCTGTLPAQNTCNLTMSVYPFLSTRVILVRFGDGVDYQVMTATIANYPVLHATTTAITSTSTDPRVLGPVTVYFQLTASNFNPAIYGLPTPTGSVTITASQGGVAYSSCTTTVSGGYPANGSCGVASLRAGDNSIVAAFTPSSGSIYAASASLAQTVTVNKVDATFGLLSQSSTTSYIQSAVTFTLAATMTGISPSGTAVVIAQNANGDQVACQGKGHCALDIGGG